MTFLFFLQNDGSGSGLNIAGGGNDWTNIIIPGDANSSEFHHEKTFLLADLIPEAQYECLVQAKNQYGWSEASRIHRFITNIAFGMYRPFKIFIVVYILTERAHIYCRCSISISNVTHSEKGTIGVNWFP